jgi:hypothetical protein
MHTIQAMPRLVRASFSRAQPKAAYSIAPTLRQRTQGCLPRAHPFFARSRSTNFWIFPVLVFGTSANTTWRGTL